jgi:predicted lysophospholipase L1 biosynthesis ABC-type transport system permease subunit
MHLQRGLQVTVIGTLRACGFSRREIGLQYLLQGGLVTVFGAIPGVILGHVLSIYLNRMYVQELHLPTASAQPHWDTIGTALALLTGLVAAYLPARLAAQLPPAASASCSPPSARTCPPWTPLMNTSRARAPTRWTCSSPAPGAMPSRGPLPGFRAAGPAPRS